MNPIFTAMWAAARAMKHLDSEKGVANGVASLGADGKVPAAQLPANGIAMSLISGSYAVFNPGPTSSSNGGAVGQILLTPGYLPDAISITEFVVEVTTGAASSSYDLGFYTNDGTTFTRHTLFGNVDTSSAGIKILTGTWTLPKGFGWFGWLGLGGVPTLRGTSTVPPHLIGPLINASTSGVSSDVKTLEGPTSLSSLPASFVSTGKVA
jgi:hypothetical protein